jgi:SpoVK/Ycf46/Vps4 family AAA+-type ATPase
MPTPPNERPPQLAIHQESNHIYKVVRHDDQSIYMERSLSYIPAVGKYKKGDGFAVKVGFGRFRASYRLLDPQEIDNIPMVTESESEKEGSGNILYEPTERDDFNRLILDEKVIETIMTGVKKIEMREELERIWGLGDLRPMTGKLAMNFYGPPGTGKTASARALARKLNKKILQVDYASMISKWVGDTAKHIREAFAEAKKGNAMLFFDEADSMLSKRVEHTGQAYESSVNQNRNVLMQELDRFDSIVIFATNFFKNYDEALLRRIAQHVKFELPNLECRLKILELKIPSKTRENGKIADDVNLKAIARMTKDFSGSELENTIANAIEYCGTNGKEKLDQATLVDELEKIKSSKEAHGSSKGHNRTIGFGFHQGKNTGKDSEVKKVQIEETPEEKEKIIFEA